MAAWLCLVVAGALEVGWTWGLKTSEGLSKPIPTAFTVFCIGASMWLLSVAARTIPLGTAYAVWVGIGVIGTTACGVIWFAEPVTAVRIACLALLVGAIIGLKVTAST